MTSCTAGAFRFEKLSRYDRPQEPCRIAVPFAHGTLTDGSRFVVTDGEHPVPTQVTVTARWPDSSVKWLLADFLADLPGNRGASFCWRTDGVAAPTPPAPAEARAEGNAVVLESGVASLRLGGAGARSPFAGLSYGALNLGPGEVRGPIWVDEAGAEWEAAVDERGWRVLQAGPVHATVEATGRHRRADGDSLMDFCLRCHAFAGKPWFQIDYRLINREDTPQVILKGLFLEVRPRRPPADARTALGISNYGTRVRQAEAGQRLHHCITAEQILYEGNEQAPEVHYGTFWADWSTPAGGLCVSLYQAQQNFPKALTTDGTGIAIWLYPDTGPSLCLRQGVARTQRLLLHLHAGGEPHLHEVGVRSLQFQMPDRPALEPEIYRAAGVFEPVWVATPVRRIEAFLVDSADARARGYGLLNWGDGPDASYTNQGRGHGKPVWTNNEYDLPHAAMLQFARTGERRMLDYLLVTAEHQMDVDVCHFSPDPYRDGGQIIHSAHHVSGGVTPSHEWVEGLLDLYHVTGNPDALDAALGIGRNLLRQLERPAFRQPAGSSARETGWALRALAALFRETGDDAWLRPAASIVEQFRDWQRQYGAWLAPYTDHTLARVPFMIAVAASSLMRYYWVTKDPTVGELIVAAMRDLIEHALLPDGRFYYKELPSLQKRGAGMYVLESLAYAYDLSGDVSFLRAGLPTLEETLRTKPAVTGTKTEVDDAVIWEAGPSPKAFASQFLPVVMFYRAATTAGLLDPDA